jgi:hypothetical protein
MAPRAALTPKAVSSMARNEYQCAIEVNQIGKYCVRVRVNFGRTGWDLPLFFMASSFDRAMKKLEQSLQYLQKREESLWFWGADRSDDPNLATELLSEVGLKLDRRAEFPRRSANVMVVPERAVPAFHIAPMRRALAEAVAPARVASD